MRKKVVEIYIDSGKGVVFITKDKKEHAFNYFTDITGAIADITIEEISAQKTKSKGSISRK